MPGTKTNSNSTPVRKRRQRLDQQPVEYIEKAMEFSDDEELGDLFYVLGQLADRPKLIEDLILDTTVHHRDGRNRMTGSWSLLYLGFVMSRHVDVQPFYNAYRQTQIWDICGFEKRPCRETVRNHFVELEEFHEAFNRFRAKLIAIAREHEPRIGQIVTADGTAYTSNARLEHICPDKKACRKAGKTHKYSERASDDQIREMRQAEKALDDPDTELTPDVLEQLQKSDPRYTELVSDDRYGYHFYNGHLYRCLDKSAAARTYSRSGRTTKTWIGGIQVAYSDDLTGLSLYEHHQSAGVNECVSFGSGFKSLVNQTGIVPEAMSLDAAYFTKKILTQLAENRVAAVIDFKEPPNLTREQMRTSEYDEHGVPRCRHCGSPGTVEGAGLGLVVTSRGKPQIRFRCANPHTPACEARTPQSISCLKEPRLLVGMSRLSPRYHSIAEARKNREHVHRHGRDRGRVAGKDLSARPRRRPIVAVQQLRSAGLGCLDAFRLCLRYGWIPGHRSVRRVVTKIRDGSKRLHNTLSARLKRGLDLPYGPAAVALGLRRADSSGLPAPPGGGGP